MVESRRVSVWQAHAAAAAVVVVGVETGCIGMGCSVSMSWCLGSAVDRTGAGLYVDIRNTRATTRPCARLDGVVGYVVPPYLPLGEDDRAPNGSLRGSSLIVFFIRICLGPDFSHLLFLNSACPVPAAREHVYI